MLPSFFTLHFPVFEMVVVLHCLPNCLSLEIWVSITSQIFVALNLPVSEIVHILPEAVYCCFTRTTLFTTIFTVILRFIQ